MEFTLGDVIAIGSVLVSLTAFFFGLRAVIKENHNLQLIEIKKVEDNSLHVRSWVEKEAEMQLRTLHELHNIKDSDGVPVWYVRQSLEKVMQGMVATVAQLSLVVQESNLINNKILAELKSFEVKN